MMRIPAPHGATGPAARNIGRPRWWPCSPTRRGGRCGSGRLARCASKPGWFVCGHGGPAPVCRLRRRQA